MTTMTAQSSSEIDAANPSPELPAARGPDTSPKSPPSRGPATRSYTRPRFGDCSRTRFEARVAFGSPDEEEIATSTREFHLLEITSVLPDDPLGVDERAASRQLGELCVHVKTAPAVVATTPGPAETLQRDWRKAARFYAIFGI
jgi:hypothetical protein